MNFKKYQNAKSSAPSPRQQRRGKDKGQVGGSSSTERAQQRQESIEAMRERARKLAEKQQSHGGSPDRES